MDELIYYLIQALIGLFTDSSKTAKGPGYPTLPPRPPTAPPGQRRPLPPGQQPQIRRRPVTQQQRPQPKTAAPPQAAHTTMPAVQFSALSVAAPASQAQARATINRPPQPATTTRAARVNAEILRRWLQPQTLQNQFMLTEIFQPPLALRAKHLE